MKPHHRPLQAHIHLSLICFVLLLAAFILLLLVGASLSVIKPIYLLRVFSVKDEIASTIATELRFGVWGVCATSVFDAPTLLTNDGDCLGPHLGYTIPDSFLSLAGVSDSLASAILTSILVVLILHLVAAGLAFFAFISAFFLASHALSILSLFLSILSAILSTVMFALDLALVLTAKNQIPNFTSDGLQADFGNGVWMVLASMICTWIAVILLSARVCYCCGVRRQHPHEFERAKEKAEK